MLGCLGVGEYSLIELTSKAKRNLKVLFIINLATSLCSGMVNPLFPLFIKDLGATVMEISLVLFIGGVTATIGIIPSGLLSDRYRRRNILMASSVMTGLAALYLAFITSWHQSVLGIVLFLSALSLFIPARHTLIADNTELSSLATTYGFMNVAWPMGFIAGPAIGGFVADNFGWNLVFYIVASVSFVSLLPNYFFHRTYRGDKGRGRKRIRRSFFSREVLLLFVVFSLFHVSGNGARGIMKLVVPLYLTETFRVNKAMVGVFLSMGFGLAPS